MKAYCGRGALAANGWFWASAVRRVRHSGLTEELPPSRMPEPARRYERSAPVFQFDENCQRARVPLERKQYDMEENKKERFVRNMRLLYAAWCVLEENGMTSGSEIVRNGRGASKDFPIVIRATEDYYVRLEYLILSLLLRDKEYEVVFQGLIEADGRMLDYLRVSVKESPEAETAVGLVAGGHPDEGRGRKEKKDLFHCFERFKDWVSVVDDGPSVSGRLARRASASCPASMFLRWTTARIRPVRMAVKAAQRATPQTHMPMRTDAHVRAPSPADGTSMRAADAARRSRTASRRPRRVLVPSRISASIPPMAYVTSSRMAVSIKGVLPVPLMEAVPLDEGGDLRVEVAPVDV